MQGFPSISCTARKALQVSLTIVARSLSGMVSIIFHGMFSSFHKKPSKKYIMSLSYGDL